MSVLALPLKCLNKKHLQLHWFHENYNYRVGSETANGILRCLVNTLPRNFAHRYHLAKCPVNGLALPAHATRSFAGPLFYMRKRR
ncbi:uncharacterized protein CEXT_317651 [Caerostris extrusa]|uniref:Uncharacterized protein n=1 Tax=Caerostris extrusa TaxID=172846 RepID=A0AAV4MWX6_CAEEX|nr:uncharacterized protein CEXT_317651 [Caerostris extrusa]